MCKRSDKVIIVHGTHQTSWLQNNQPIQRKPLKAMTKESAVEL